MGNDLKQPATVKERAVRRWEESLGFRISLRVTAVGINATRNQLIAVMAFLSILILAALVVLIRRITRPLADISGRMQDFSRGDLRGDIQVWGKDEIGRLADSIRSSTRSLKDMIGDISHILEEISGGNLDLRVKGTYIGDFRFIKEALERIVQSLNETLGQIGISAEQVSNGSEQAAAGAQALAQGAAEQAGTVEEADHCQCGQRRGCQPESRGCGQGSGGEQPQDAGHACSHAGDPFRFP